VEEGIKPGQKAAQDALKQVKDNIPHPEDAKKQAKSLVEGAAKPAAQAVKDNAKPAAQKIESEAIRPAQKAAESLPGHVKVGYHRPRSSPSIDWPSRS
jgi:hypothetical protein